MVPPCFHVSANAIPGWRHIRPTGLRGLPFRAIRLGEVSILVRKMPGPWASPIPFLESKGFKASQATTLRACRSPARCSHDAIPISANRVVAA